MGATTRTGNPVTVLRNLGQGVLAQARFSIDSGRRLHRDDDGKLVLVSPTFASWNEAERFVREHGRDGTEYILVPSREVPPGW